jgi:hypothetical protein
MTLLSKFQPHKDPSAIRCFKVHQETIFSCNEHEIVKWHQDRKEKLASVKPKGKVLLMKLRHNGLLTSQMDA